MPKLGWWGRGGLNGNGNSARTHQHLCLLQHQGYKGGLQGKTYKRKTGKMASKRGKTPLSGFKNLKKNATPSKRIYIQRGKIYGFFLDGRNAKYTSLYKTAS